MTGVEVITWVTFGFALRHFVPRVYAALCEWAEGLRVEVEAERAIARRSRLVASCAPRAVPEPIRLLRSPYDQRREVDA